MAVGVSGLIDEGAHGGAGYLGDLLVQLVDKQALIVTAVHLVDVASNGGGNDTRDALNAVLGTIQLGNVDQGGDGLLGGGWDANRMQSAGRRRLLIRMIWEYTLPVMLSRCARSMFLASKVSRLGRSLISLSRLQVQAVDTMELTMAGLVGTVQSTRWSA